MTTSLNKHRAAVRPSYYTPLDRAPVLPGDRVTLFPLSNPLLSADGLIFSSAANSGAVRREPASALCPLPTHLLLSSMLGLPPVTLRSVFLSKASLLYACPGFHLLSHRGPVTPASLKHFLHEASKITFSRFSSCLSDSSSVSLTWCLLISLTSKIEKPQGSAAGLLPSSNCIRLLILTHGFKHHLCA